jgi:hypothetical protein
LFRRQGIAVLWHAIVAVESEDPPHDETLFALAGHDDRPVSPPFVIPRRIEAQMRLCLLRAVTLVAARLEDWLDVASEIDRGLRCGEDSVRQR